MLLWQVAAFPRKLLQIVRRGWRNASSATVEDCKVAGLDDSADQTSDAELMGIANGGSRLLVPIPQ
jgi:hypothetical protein